MAKKEVKATADPVVAPEIKAPVKAPEKVEGWIAVNKEQLDKLQAEGKLKGYKPSEGLALV